MHMGNLSNFSVLFHFFPSGILKFSFWGTFTFKYAYLFIWECEYSWVSMFCVHMSAYIFVCQRSHPGTFLRMLSTFFLRQHFSLAWNLPIWLGWPNICLSPLFVCLILSNLSYLFFSTFKLTFYFLWTWLCTHYHSTFKNVYMEHGNCLNT